ncbi:uncharacterized protein LOC124163564 [Ischnura elegans]|uniref:uncharacterized protein LOC124163564 n=1 Tax=Ischnura elegans TaxID=197161 RepID=UPI001ED8B990|nr:uncharacterized protein LOC124163564 [Ischnura elegans]XP_046396508.1 uncharacterized protein LOC124163564 [Ischnura elegans]
MPLKWQAMRLPPPPNRCQITDSRDILSLKKVCSSFLKVLLNQKPLHVEAALLSRIIYRMKTKFRHDKGLKLMEKVNRCLLQYLRVNLASVYGNFTSCFKTALDGEHMSAFSRKVHAPSRQMLEFLILRTLGFIKLLSKAVQYCEEAAIYLQNRIYIGHSWNYALVALSIISRIWCLSKYLVLTACDHYKNILPYIEKLDYIGCQWNENESSYPMDIDNWLDVWWVNRKSPPKRKGKSEDEVTCLDTIFLDSTSPGDDSSFVKMTGILEINRFDGVKNDADLGEPVARSSMKKQPINNLLRPSMCVSESSVKVKENKNPLLKVKSTEDLLKLLENEERKRSKKIDSALTKNMDKFQFNIFTNKIHKFVKKLNGLDCPKDSTEYKLAFKKCKKILRLYIQ